jgi:hypothetical protein
LLGSSEVNVVTITGGPSGGTFTITVNGQTTAGIAYNAIASVVQTALEALSNVAPGDVTVTGSAGGPYTLTWDGALANTDVTISSSGASLTGGTTPAATTTTTTPGGITIHEVQAIAPPEQDVYIDTTFGGIGTTKVDVKSADVAFTGLTRPDWRINSALTSYKKDVLQVPTLTCNVVTANSDGSDGEFDSRQAYQDLLDGDTLYLRLKAEGPEIESGQTFLFQADMAVKAGDNMAQLADSEGFETLPLPLSLVHDATMGTALQVLVRNDLTSVA